MVIGVRHPRPGSYLPGPEMSITNRRGRAKARVPSPSMTSSKTWQVLRWCMRTCEGLNGAHPCRPMAQSSGLDRARRLGHRLGGG